VGTFWISPPMVFSKWLNASVWLSQRGKFKDVEGTLAWMYLKVNMFLNGSEEIRISVEPSD
jgi:hypothetical protein